MGRLRVFSRGLWPDSRVGFGVEEQCDQICARLGGRLCFCRTHSHPGTLSVGAQAQTPSPLEVHCCGRHCPQKSTALGRGRTTCCFESFTGCPPTSQNPGPRLPLWLEGPWHLSTHWDRSVSQLGKLRPRGAVQLPPGLPGCEREGHVLLTCCHLLGACGPCVEGMSGWLTRGQMGRDSGAQSQFLI